MDKAEILKRLDEQDWRCVYPCAAGVHGDVGGKILSRDELAFAYDGYGICHLRCARIGVAPTLMQIVKLRRGNGARA
jgi:hypothetical protein